MWQTRGTSRVRNLIKTKLLVLIKSQLILDYRRTKWLHESVIKYMKVYLVKYYDILSKSVEARRHTYFYVIRLIFTYKFFYNLYYCL